MFCLNYFNGPTIYGLSLTNILAEPKINTFLLSLFFVCMFSLLMTCRMIRFIIFYDVWSFNMWYNSKNFMYYQCEISKQYLVPLEVTEKKNVKTYQIGVLVLDHPNTISTDKQQDNISKQDHLEWVLHKECFEQKHTRKFCLSNRCKKTCRLTVHQLVFLFQIPSKQI